ncbi:MAG TPA: ArsI/CadI family heavy metal resistance metalloenzyme [Planctomycetota bacterium]|nr:ArsI/CadI family heavy metal resistance metalloenzyme [Planctomycetota bacterium]
MTKFHASVSCSNLPASIAFYKALLGAEPAKLKADYAKWEVDVPPLVLSVIPGTTTPGWNVNHLGLRVPDAPALVKIQERLEAAGFPCKREEGVECCYALQTKFWIADPDRTLWEVYVLEEDREEFGKDTVPRPASTAFAKDVARPRMTWAHRLGEPLPARVPHDDNSLHEAALEGTFNDDVDPAPLLKDVYRALRPGGELRIRGLAGDQPFCGTLALPGPAAAVKRVPVDTEPLKALQAAGFVDARFERFSPKAHFTVDNVAMREIVILARKPGHRPKTAAHIAVYQGPLAQVRDDYGNVYPRGERVTINIHDWQALKNGPVAASFLLLTPDQAPAAGCGKT